MRRFLSALLAAVLCVGLIPGNTALAENLEQQNTNQDEDIAFVQEDQSNDNDVDAAQQSLEPRQEVQQQNIELYASTLWPNTNVAFNTTITILADGTFEYQGTTYHFNPDGSSILTAANGLTLVLNNTAPVTLKKVRVNLGNLTISGAGEMHAVDSVQDYEGAIHVDRGSLTLQNATLKASGNDFGVYAGMIIVSSGVVIGVASADYATGVHSDQITAQDNGSIYGTGGSTGVGGQSIEVLSGATVVGEATASSSMGVSVSRSILVDGVGSSLEGTGTFYGISLKYFTRAPGDLNTIVAQNHGTISGTGGEAGVHFYNAGGLVAAYSSATITGTAPYCGINGMMIAVESDGSGSVVKGVATATSRVQDIGVVDRNTSAIMIDNVDPSSGHIIQATNGGVVWEDYPNISLAFDDVTPTDPYYGGVNIDSIANYSWTPDLEVDSAATGLLALAGHNGVQNIMGARTGDVVDELVSLDSTSTHKVSFLGTLVGPFAPTFSVTYDPNGATGGSAPVDSNAYDTNDTVTVLGKNSLEKSDHKFIGWNTKGNASVALYSAGDTFTITADVVLYAIWEELEEDPIVPDPVPEPEPSPSDEPTLLTNKKGELAKAGDYSFATGCFFLSCLAAGMLVLSSRIRKMRDSG